MATQMIITIDIETGKTVNVTDEKGNPAKRYEPNQKNPLPLSGVIGGGGATIIRTQSSPACVWYERDGIWFQLCTS